MSARHAILSLLWSRHGGRRVVLRPGDVIRVGRGEEADFVVLDRDLCPVHFEIDWDGERAEVRDRSRHHGVRDGTRLGGLSTKQAWARHGSLLEAGSSRFFVHYEGATPPLVPPDPALAEPRARALASLEALAQGGELHAVVDAACDERVLIVLREAIDEIASLYEGFDGHVLADVAPYLVRFAPSSRLLRVLVEEGWGSGWAIFFTSPHPFGAVRRHLRRFLMALDETTGQRVYFRFYDPSVLRELLPIATDRQLEQLHADVVQTFVAEGEALELMRFHAPRRAGVDAHPDLAAGRADVPHP